MAVSQSLAAALAFLTALGLGGLAPRAVDRDLLRPGLRLALGGALLAAVPFWVSVVGSAPLSLAAASMAAAALVGLIRLARRLGPADILHPALVLPILVVGMVATIEPVGFHVPSWDDYSNWLGMARRLFLTDAFPVESIPALKRDYIPGWMLMLGYPAFLTGRFDDGGAALVTALPHVAMLGLAFDLVRMQRAKDGIAFGWVAVMIVLGAEGLWKLVPYLVWVELAQAAFIAAALATAAMAGPEADRRPLAVAAGLLVAAAILAKISSVVAVPAVALGFLVLPGRWRQRMVPAMLAVALPAVTWLAWTLVKPIGESGCVGSVGSMLTAGASALNDAAAGSVMTLVLGTALSYAAGYKTVVSVGAILGLGLAALRPVGRPLAAGVALFAVVYVAAVAWTYLGCPTSFNYMLSSLQRYLQVPLRVLHVLGLTAAALLVAGMWRGVAGPWACRVATLAAVLFLGWQTTQIRQSLSAMDGATTASPALRQLLLAMPGQTRELLDWARRNGHDAPSVLLLDHAPDGFGAVLADHHALPDIRERRSAWPAFHELPPEHFSSPPAEVDLIWVLNEDARPSWLPAGTCPASAVFELRLGVATGLCHTLGTPVSAREP